jgi:hypothetical protein
MQICPRCRWRERRPGLTSCLAPRAWLAEPAPALRRSHSAPSAASSTTRTPWFSAERSSARVLRCAALNRKTGSLDSDVAESRADVTRPATVHVHSLRGGRPHRSVSAAIRSRALAAERVWRLCQSRSSAARCSWTRLTQSSEISSAWTFSRGPSSLTALGTSMSRCWSTRWTVGSGARASSS